VQSNLILALSRSTEEEEEAMNARNVAHESSPQLSPKSIKSVPPHETHHIQQQQQQLHEIETRVHEMETKMNGQDEKKEARMEELSVAIANLQLRQRQHEYHQNIENRIIQSDGRESLPHVDQKRVCIHLLIMCHMCAFARRPSCQQCSTATR
jgi:TolA-binding protein